MSIHTLVINELLGAGLLILQYQVYYFEDDKGDVPVRDYILKQTEPIRAKIFAYIDYLKKYGPQVKRPMGDSLGGGTGLYELRPARHRVIYFYFERNKIILLHAFLKKSQQIPKRELKKAEDRKDICEVLGKYRLLSFEE